METSNVNDLKSKKKRSKFGATKVAINGIKFDSKKEAERYQHLELLQRASVISNLQVHPIFKLIVKGVHICDYEADFEYIRMEDSKRIVEDVKALGKKIKGKKRFSTKTPLYQAKKRLVKALYGINISEIV